MSHKFWCIEFLFSSFSEYFLTFLVILSWIYRLFKSMFFNFYNFVSFPVFFFMLLISNFIPLWPEEILCMISTFHNLLRLHLWPNLWPILENAPCTLRRMCTQPLLGETFCLCLLDLTGVFCCVLYSLAIFCFIVRPLRCVSIDVSNYCCKTTIVFLPSILAFFGCYSACKCL